jgi:hypothetical protein
VKVLAKLGEALGHNPALGSGKREFASERVETGICNVSERDCTTATFDVQCTLREIFA